MIPYCEQFQEYRKPGTYLTEDGKKQPPPCGVCADACSRRRRARDMKLQAEIIERAADEVIKKGHP